jgi:hypothetical protein
MKITDLVSLLCLVAASPAAHGMETVAHCTLGRDRGHMVALSRDHAIDTTAVYYLSKDGGAPVRLYPGDADQSRGDDIHAACVGSKERALVVSGEFRSNYLQGVAIRYNDAAKRWEQVSFAERTRPARVYLNAKGLTVLIPNSGRNESSKQYIIYRYDGHANGAVQTYSDHAPRSQGIRIPQPESQR